MSGSDEQTVDSRRCGVCDGHFPSAVTDKTSMFPRSTSKSITAPAILRFVYNECKIRLRLWWALSKIYTRSLTEDVTTPAILRSIQNGCRICTSLWYTLSEIYGRSLTEEVEIDWQYGKDVWESAWISVGPDDSEMQLWEFVVSTDRRSPVTRQHGSHLLTESMHEGPSCRPPSCGRTGCEWCERVPPTNRAPSGYTGSHEALQTIRQWLKECIDDHPKCGGNKPNPLPTRVVEILDHDSAHCRLLITEEDQLDRYACLTHRWAAETEGASLKRDNLEAFQERIPPTCLYPLLRDAIRVAGELGLRYIWIDCMVSIVPIDPSDPSVATSNPA